MKFFVKLEAPTGSNRTIIYDGRSYRFSGGVEREVSAELANYLRSYIKHTPGEKLFSIVSKSDSGDLPEESVGASFIQEILL